MVSAWEIDMRVTCEIESALKSGVLVIKNSVTASRGTLSANQLLLGRPITNDRGKIFDRGREGSSPPIDASPERA